MRSERPIQPSAWFKLQVLIFGTLLFAGFVWWAGFTYQKHRYFATRDALVKEGAPASLDRYHRAFVEDSKNAALLYRVAAGVQGDHDERIAAPEDSLRLIYRAADLDDAQYIRLAEHLEHGSMAFFDQEQVGALLVRELNAAIKRGDHSAAARLLESSFHWANSLVADPVHDAILLRNEYAKKFLRAGRKIIDRRPIDGPILVELGIELDEIRNLDSLQSAFGIVFAERAKDWRRQSWCGTCNSTLSLPADIAHRTEVLRELALLYRYADAHYFLGREHFDSLRIFARTPGSAVPSYWFQGFLESIVTTNEIICRADFLELGNAIRRYQRLEHRWPARLSDIRPMFMDSPLVDPFSGTQYSYLLTKQGVMLYSVGLNGTDNGGKGDDIVWSLDKSRVAAAL